MASEQAKIEVEKDRVPKMASHFESLAEKGKGDASPSLEEISNARATAQQNSIGAIRAAEERYQDQKAATVESGKGVSGYAMKVKDQAVVVTHYTLEKVVDATKTVAGVTSSVAGYAKDKVAGAGEKLAAAKDAVVATEEKAADYDVRKKAEAQKSSRSAQGQGEEGLSVGERLASENMEECSEGAEEGEQTSNGGGTVFQAIGETIVEIGQTTKDLLAGQNPLQEKSRKENEE